MTRVRGLCVRACVPGILYCILCSFVLRKGVGSVIPHPKKIHGRIRFTPLSSLSSIDVSLSVGEVYSSLKVTQLFNNNAHKYYVQISVKYFHKTTACGKAYASNSKHWFTTSFLQGRCRKAMLGVWLTHWTTSMIQRAISLTHILHRVEDTRETCLMSVKMVSVTHNH